MSAFYAVSGFVVVAAVATVIVTLLDYIAMKRFDRDHL